MKQVKTILVLSILLATAVAATPLLAQAKSHRDIDFPPLPGFEIPQPEIYELSNGLKVFLIEDHELPLISVDARIRTGSHYMPGDKTGMGSIFGQVQREGGTASMTGDEIDDFLEARAASVETGMGGDAGTASMNCLEEDFDDVLRVFVDVLRKPAFAEDKIELAKVQLNTSIARRNDSPGAIVGREFTKLIYGADSPLASVAEYATVAAVERDDLLAWHARHYHPNNIYIGVSGDFDSAAMKRKLEAAFGSWPKGPAFDEPEVAYDSSPEPGVYFVEKEDVTQANIRMGHLGIERSNPDYYAVEVMNDVLGAGFSGRLMKNIRSKKGLTYSVFGGVGATFLRPGIFQAGTSTKSSTMAESTRALEQELAGMIANPPTAEELQLAKESILNSFVFNYTSTRQILRQQMQFAYFGLPTNYLDSYRAKIEQVTAADVARVAKKYIHPDKLVVLIVGKSAEYDEPVTALGQAREIDIAIAPPADTRPEVTRTASSMAAGGAVFERMASKMFGGDPNPVRSVKSTLTLLMSMGGQSMSLGQEISFVMPDKLRQTVKTPMGEQVVVINGDAGVVFAGGQQQPFPKERAVEGLESLSRNLLVLASQQGNPDLEAVAAGKDEVDGAACDLIAVSFRGTESRLCVDKEGTVLMQSYQGKHPLRGMPGLIEVRFSEYQEMDGHLFPRKHAMSFEGEEVATMTFDALDINPELDPAQFDVSTN